MIMLSRHNSFRNLRNLSLSIRNLRNISHSIRNLRNISHSIRHLRNISHSIRNLRNISHSSRNLRNISLSQHPRSAAYPIRNLRKRWHDSANKLSSKSRLSSGWRLTARFSAARSQPSAVAMPIRALTSFSLAKAENVNLKKKNGHAHISNLHCQLPCCCALCKSKSLSKIIASFLAVARCYVASRNLSQKSTFIMPPKSRRSSRAGTPSTSLNSPGSLAAKQAPPPSEVSPYLTAIKGIADQLDRMLTPSQAKRTSTSRINQHATSTDVPAAVPPHLREPIVRGEFEQFGDLLLESMSNTADEPLNLAVIGDGHLRIHRSSTEIKRRVCNLGTWLEAWTVFCRVLVDAAPELAPDVLQ